MAKKSSGLLTFVTGLAVGAAALFLSKKENRDAVKKEVKKVKQVKQKVKKLVVKKKELVAKKVKTVATVAKKQVKKLKTVPHFKV